MRDDIEARYFVEAAAKVLDVLDSFSSAGEELSITEIARRTGSTYSSAFRLLYTLEKRGYVMRRPKQKRYMLSPTRQRFRIGFATLQATVFQREVTWSILAAARRLAMNVIVRNNEQFNISKALLNADELLRQKIDLLIEYQFNDTAAHIIAAKCHDAGVPSIAINFVQPGAYYFGGNNYLTGFLAGNFFAEYARTHWKGQADACLILPAKGLGATQEARKAGILDSLRQGLPGLRSSEIVEAPPALTVRDAAEVTRKMLVKFGSRKKRILVAGLTDPLAIGADKALCEKGLEQSAAVVGQGGGRDARNRLVKEGAFKASIAFFPEAYGERVMSIALSIIEGQTTSSLPGIT
jgi:ribose transport system substrate-binding protein